MTQQFISGMPWCLKAVASEPWSQSKANRFVPHTPPARKLRAPAVCEWQGRASDPSSHGPRFALVVYCIMVLCTHSSVSRSKSCPKLDWSLGFWISTVRIKEGLWLKEQLYQFRFPSKFYCKQPCSSLSHSRLIPEPLQMMLRSPPSTIRRPRKGWLLNLSESYTQLQVPKQSQNILKQ